jgi:quinolinate synthase
MNELIEKIVKLRSELGSKVIIPVHHYIIPEIVEIGDFVGDSYKLAVECSRSKAEYIVMCGVLFMAEGAKILASEKQKVLIPQITAGCPLANMIEDDAARNVHKKLTSSTQKEVIPVTYMNSYAATKSFCGEHGGAVCTSSNAVDIIRYYHKQGKAVFFSPDYNLGINSANLLGLGSDEVMRVDSDTPEGDYSKVKLFIWDGFCIVHKRFHLSDIEQLRKTYPKINIIVHPECDEEIVEAADMSGSTQKIYNEVKDAADGSVWGIGTEYHFVHRLQMEYPSKTIVPLRRSDCFNMGKIDLESLYLSLQSIQAYENNEGELKIEVEVSQEHMVNARKALEKMIRIVESGK